MSVPEFVCGQEHRAPYPFVRTTWEAPPEDPCEMDAPPNMQTSWRPGVEHENLSQYSEWTYAEGMGEVVFTVVAVFKPGSYPERVFYLRNWITPDGKRFGKNNLRMTTTQNFRQLIKGYRHDYEMAEAE